MVYSIIITTTKIGTSMYCSFYKRIRILQTSSKSFISNIIILMQIESFQKNRPVYNCDEVPEQSKLY